MHKPTAADVAEVFRLLGIEPENIESFSVRHARVTSALRLEVAQYRRNEQGARYLAEEGVEYAMDHIVHMIPIPKAGTDADA